jgi:hypothetical protein
MARTRIRARDCLKFDCSQANATTPSANAAVFYQEAGRARPLPRARIRECLAYVGSASAYDMLRHDDMPRRGIQGWLPKL